MRRTFNCGIGMVAIVAAADVEDTLGALRAAGEDAWHLGQIAAGDREVQYL
jgi:phosphoribosylformylglycinamidine cyclo-ligase